MMNSSCRNAHVIAHFGSGFVSKELIKRTLGNELIGVFRALCLHLCEVPGINGHFHCHCDDHMSLSCQSTAAILKRLCAERFRPSKERTPYFWCCTRFVLFRINNTCYIKCRWRHCQVAMEVLRDFGFEYKYYLLAANMFSLLEFSCESHLTSVVMTVLHQRINLDDDNPSGYHFGTWEGWKDGVVDTSEGRYCSLRFIDVHGTSVQERSIRKKGNYSKYIQRCRMPPPRHLDNGKWRCFYRFTYCDCNRKCYCEQSYDYIDLSNRTIERYASDMLRVPHDLKVYCQFYASVML